MHRLDQTLDHFVDDGRLSPGLAADLRQEYYSRHVDVRQRLAELTGYVGAALAVLGMVVIGSQVWSDFAQVLRAGLAAIGCAGLLVSSFALVHGRDLAGHAARARLAQVMGVCAAILGALTVMVAFSLPEASATWQRAGAFAVATLIAFVVSRWVPGFITTLATGVFTLALGFAVLELLPIHNIGPGPFGAYMLVLGILATSVLYRFFPPDWLTLLMGVVAWLFGDLMLLMAHAEYEAMNTPAEYWTWIGRIGAVALIVVGTWAYARGGDLPWAIGAALSSAMLVGLWSAQALNAGVALVVAGLVLIGVGVGLARWRHALHHPGTTPDAAAKI